MVTAKRNNLEARWEIATTRKASGLAMTNPLVIANEGKQSSTPKHKWITSKDKGLTREVGGIKLF